MRTLSERELIDVFAFAPKAFGVSNHIHLIWRTNKLIRLLSDGKETAQASFLKFTAHEFKKMLRKDTDELSKYPVDAHNKKYEFWQRDSLAIHLYSRHVMSQKLNYIHMNPLAPHWLLVTDPCQYKYSSAGFYECNIKSFDFLKDVREEF